MSIAAPARAAATIARPRGSGQPPPPWPTRITTVFLPSTTGRAVSGSAWPSGCSVRTPKNLVRCARRPCPFIQPPMRRAELISPALILVRRAGPSNTVSPRRSKRMAAVARGGADPHRRAAQCPSTSVSERSVALAGRSRCRPPKAHVLAIRTGRAGSIRAAHLRRILRRSVRGRRTTCNDPQAEVRWIDEVVRGDVGGTCCAWFATRRTRASGGRRDASSCEARRHR